MFLERSRAPTNQLLYNLLSFSRVGMRAGAARGSESARVVVRARDDVRARRSRATAATTTTRAAKSSDGEMDEQRYDAVVVGAVALHVCGVFVGRRSGSAMLVPL